MTERKKISSGEDLAQMSEALRDSLPPESVESFDELVGALALGVDGMKNPPAFLSVEDTALRAFLAWSERMATDLNPSPQLAICLGVISGYQLAQTRIAETNSP